MAQAKDWLIGCLHQCNEHPPQQANIAQISDITPRGLQAWMTELVASKSLLSWHCLL